MRGDLAAEAEPGGQAEAVTAPEPAGVIPAQLAAAGQQPPVLAGHGQHLGAAGGLQAGLAYLAPDGRPAAGQPPRREPGRGGEGVPSSRAIVRTTASSISRVTTGSV